MRPSRGRAPGGDDWQRRPYGRASWPRHRRGPFVRRLAFVLILFLTLSVGGANVLLVWLLRSAGIATHAPDFATVSVTAPLIFLVVLLFFILSMRRIGLPFGDIVAAADRVAAGDYDTRIEERGPPFLRVVARAFNRMTVTLQAQDRQRRDLLADIAHELRTPLAVMQGRREVVLNLLANAIRHTQEGAEVTISVTQNTGELVIAVRDTGPGMSADEIAKVFDRFQKGPRSRGSGLGLAITRHLVEAHGGKIG